MNAAASASTLKHAIAHHDYPAAKGDRVRRLYDGKLGKVISKSASGGSLRSIVRWDKGGEDVFYFGLAAYGPPQIAKVER